MARPSPRLPVKTVGFTRWVPIELPAEPTEDLDVEPTLGLYIVTDGDLTFWALDNADDEEVTIPVVAGQYILGCVRRIGGTSAGTTATVAALY